MWLTGGGLGLTEFTGREPGKRSLVPEALALKKLERKIESRCPHF